MRTLLMGRVLLADDGPDNQVLIGALLRGQGLEVTVVEDGQQALDAVLAAAPDLVLMDVQMPNMDGLEATRRLRASGHRGPIVALTANLLPGVRERCLTAGCDDFLTKPLDRGEFQALLARHLAARTGFPTDPT